MVAAARAPAAVFRHFPQRREQWLIVVAVRAYEMLSAPDSQSSRKEEQAKPVGEAVSDDLASYAFFPLTLPFTTGPGTIAVAVSIGTVRPDGLEPMVMFYTGATVAALAMAVVIWVSYTTADRMAAVTSVLVFALRPPAPGGDAALVARSCRRSGRSPCPKASSGSPVPRSFDEWTCTARRS